MSTGATLLANVRLADGGIADLRMSEGVIDAIGPNLEAAGAEVIDGGGLLTLPGMIDGHVHLDKTLTGLPRMPYPAGPDRASRIATERGLRARLPPPAERASNLGRQAVAAGTTAFDCASAAARRVFGHDDRGIALGAPADLFTVRAETLGEAVAQHPPRGLVFKGGRLVARDGTCLG